MSGEATGYLELLIVWISQLFGSWTIPLDDTYYMYYKLHYRVVV